MKIDKMTTREKIELCSGKNFWHTKAMPAHGIPSIMMCDGPHGLRKQENAADMLGLNNSVPATCFPTAVATGCSWDVDLMQEIGSAIAREAKANQVGVVLGPGANIKRNPLCGRNFEYISEDPYLTGKMAASYIRGAEGEGVSTSLKHFAANSQEYKRFSSDSIMDERTLREIYLTGFEIAVKEGKPSTVMSAYNKLNGVYCSDNKWLLTDILRKEWGFDGMVVTDWGGMGDRIKAFRAGCDLMMPGGSAYMEAEAAQAVVDGSLDISDVDRSAQRVCRLVARAAEAVHGSSPVDMQIQYELARRAAAESAVLLKNEGNILPIAEKEDVVFIGHMAESIRYQGSGSSHINPWKLMHVTDACPDVPYAAGCDSAGNTTDALISEAIALAKNTKTAVVFAGLTDKYESEGFDRSNMRMPEGHIRMIEAVAAANPNTVVVLMCGSPVEIPWADRVRGILFVGLPGEAGGDAISDLLFGKVSPSGKLAESWPMRYEDCPSAGCYGNGRKDAHYREGVYVGYRYYASAGVPVRYPFGYGLSYAEFAYSNLRIDGDTICCSVRNTGKVAAKEIVQLYVAPPKGNLYRPAKELKGFAKINLQPGEEKSIVFHLNDRSFAVWNDGWCIPGGKYTVQIGSSSESLPLEGFIEKPHAAIPALDVSEWYHKPVGVPSHADFVSLIGYEPAAATLKKGEFTMKNTIMEMKDYSSLMRVFYKTLEFALSMRFGGRKAHEDPTYLMMINSAADASLSSMKINVGMNNYLMEGLLEMANGRFFKGLRLMFRRSKKGESA